MMNSDEIHITSSSSSSSSGDSETSVTEECRHCIAEAGVDSLAQQEDEIAGPDLVEVYDIDQEGQTSEIDLCDTTLSSDDIEELSDDDSSMNWYRYPQVSQPIPIVDDPIVERMLGMGFNRASLSESLQSGIFARILDQVRSQAMIINRLSAYHIDPHPRVLPSVILSKLVCRRLSNAAEATTLGSCPICLDKYTARMSVRVVPGCGHLVHKPCMDKWITQSNKYTCPLDNLPIEIPESAVAISPVEIAEAAFPSGRRQSDPPDRRSLRLRRRLG